ncbi:MAG: flavin reductase family protein [Candidatus Nezhaarchaeota archaeon]|nr:flavin reductase family protein [Candidatus Nezhaarchaeota archaeon]
MSQLRISEELYPRLTVLITTCSKDGSYNVATFSFIMPVSFEPKYLAFSISPFRQTFKNLKEVGEFVVNIPTEDMLQKVWICGTKSGKDVNKFDLARLEIIESKKVRPPRIKDCPIQLECKVEFMKEFGDHYIVVGKVVEEHVERGFFKPILHYSGKQFFKVGEMITA